MALSLYASGCGSSSSSSIDNATATESASADQNASDSAEAPEVDLEQTILDYLDQVGLRIQDEVASSPLQECPISIDEETSARAITSLTEVAADVPGGREAPEYSWSAAFAVVACEYDTPGRLRVSFGVANDGWRERLIAVDELALDDGWKVAYEELDHLPARLVRFSKGEVIIDVVAHGTPRGPIELGANGPQMFELLRGAISPLGWSQVGTPVASVAEQLCGDLQSASSDYEQAKAVALMNLRAPDADEVCPADIDAVAIFAPLVASPAIGYFNEVTIERCLPGEIDVAIRTENSSRPFTIGMEVHLDGALYKKQLLPAITGDPTVAIKVDRPYTDCMVQVDFMIPLS